MLEVGGHVVAAEGQHREWIEAELTDLAECGGGLLRRHRRAEEHTVPPVEGLADERHDGGAAAAEEEGIDRHSGRVLPLAGDRGRLLRRDREAGVRVSGWVLGVGGPVVPVPVDGVCRRVGGHPLPPDVSVVGQGRVREDRVLADRRHRVRVGLLARPRRHPEEARLRIDRVETAVVAELHPGDVVADRLHRPAGQSRDQHRQVRLATRRREGPGHVFHLAVRRGQLQDQHVLCHPALVVGHG